MCPQERALESDEASTEIAGELVSQPSRPLYLTQPLKTAQYEKAQTIAPLLADVEQYVPVVLARAGFEKRQIEAGNAGEHSVSTFFLRHRLTVLT